MTTEGQLDWLHAAASTKSRRAAPRARARDSDPASSHAAAADVEAWGTAAAQREAALAAVRRNPGKTAAELARLVGGTKLEQDRTFRAFGRRLPELRKAGQVRNGAAAGVRCTVSGRLALTWWPV